MSHTLDASIAVAFAHMIQALQLSKSALGLVKLYPIDPIPIRLALYENALDSLTAAFATIQLLPFIQLPPNPIYLNNPAIPSLQDTQIIGKLAANQTILAISRIGAATRYIDQIMLLSGSGDSDVLCLLISIRTDLVSARNALIVVVNTFPL